VEWKRCNILYGSNDVFAKAPKPIGKLAFGCFVNLKKCRNLSLGLATKAKACKGVGQEECERG
jgi:hypothetical protein